MEQNGTTSERLPQMEARNRMSEIIKMIGGPLDGHTVGPWEPYPERMVFEYECVRNPSAVNLVSGQVELEGAERLIAEYDFDDGWRAYTFAGWTVKRMPMDRPGDFPRR